MFHGFVSITGQGFYIVVNQCKVDFTAVANSLGREIIHEPCRLFYIIANVNEFVYHVLLNLFTSCAIEKVYHLTSFDTEKVYHFYA